jgi:hypothetical protein
MERPIVDPYLYFDPDDLQEKSFTGQRRPQTTSSQVFLQTSTTEEYVPYNAEGNIKLRLPANRRRLPIDTMNVYVPTVDTWVINPKRTNVIGAHTDDSLSFGRRAPLYGLTDNDDTGESTVWIYDYDMKERIVVNAKNLCLTFKRLVPDDNGGVGYSYLYLSQSLNLTIKTDEPSSNNVIIELD